MEKTSLIGRLILAIAMLAIFATTTMAQTNPKPGYIITNDGDTVRGIIDFRTNEKLSKQCDFWANGGSEGKIYKPGDIEGLTEASISSHADSLSLAIRSYILWSLWFKER